MSEQHTVEQQTVQPEANGQEAVAAQQLESLRGRYPTLARRVEGGELALDAALAEAAKRDSKPRSGFGRLKQRHRRLIAEKENLEAEFHAVRAELVEWRSMYLQLKDDLAPLIEAKSNG